jgi:hypothetical protein
MHGYLKRLYDIGPLGDKFLEVPWMDRQREGYPLPLSRVEFRNLSEGFGPS